MFLRSAGLPSDGQTLYIFLYIDSNQGGRARGMGNKSDKGAPFAFPFLLSLLSLAEATFLHFLFISFFLFPFINIIQLYRHIYRIVLLSIRLLLHSMLRGLCNIRADVMWLGSVLTQSRITSH